MDWNPAGQRKVESTFCDACSTIPWAALLLGDAYRSPHPSNGFRYQPKGKPGAINEECNICQILFSSDSGLEANFVTVRVRHEPSLIADTDGTEEAGTRSVLFERDLTDRHTLIIAELNIYLPSETDPQSTFERSRVLDSHFSRIVTNSKVFLLPRSWMETCAQTHSKCGSVDDANLPLPTRLLDIGLESADSIRLFETVAGSSGRYAALSHCWGSVQTFTTSRESLMTRKTSIQFNELPPTFQDAVTVSRSLGLNYLWIDSLCIVQGDGGDWEREAHKMSDVYSNATMVISASRSAADSSGFLFPRLIGEIIAINGDNAEQEPVLYLQRVMGSLTPYADPLASEPLSLRAWALQERYLARRTLSFGSCQMFWECKTHFLAEDGRRQNSAKYRIDHLIPVKTNHSLIQLSEEEFGSHKYWYSMIESFMSRKITFRSDRLPAISGLAEYMHSKTGDEYLVGLWKNSLICGLLWRKYRCAILKRQESFRIPSWSWAAVEGEIEFCMFTWFNDFLRGIEIFAVLCDYQIQALGNPFGNISEGHIVLKAPSLSIMDLKGPFTMKDYPELSHSGPGIYLHSYGSFHRVFEWMVAINYADTTLFIAASLDFPHEHADIVDLQMILLAGESSAGFDSYEGLLPSNEGYFGLILQRKSGSKDVYTRAGVVHGKFMAEDESIGAKDLFEKYRYWKRDDYLASIGKVQTRPDWYSMSVDELDKAVVIIE